MLVAEAAVLIFLLAAQLLERAVQGAAAMEVQIQP
jgi:hypothetical protein